MRIWQCLVRNSRRQGFVLALGGGGGRGLAHLGVLEALEQNGLRPSAIVGTSIGALFGAMYSLRPDIREVRERILAFLHSEAFTNLQLPVLEEAETSDQTWLGKLTAAARQSVLYTRLAMRIGIPSADNLVDMVRVLCENKGFDDIQIPLFVTAVHFPTGERNLFSKGHLAHAVAASMAVPAVFEPVEIEGERFVDGGLAAELPAREAKMVAKRGQAVVAVNVGSRPREQLDPAHVIAMLDWALRIKSLYLRQHQREFAELVIEPLIGHRRWIDFSHPNQEIERGRQAALEKMPELYALVGP